MLSSIARVFLLAVILMTACSAPPAIPPELSVKKTPVFEPHDCWLTMPDGIAAACGFVVVPQNRNKPSAEENTVRLAVVVLQAPGVDYPQPPTFLLGGGPGQDVIGLFDGLFRDYAALTDEEFPPE